MADQRKPSSGRSRRRSGGSRNALRKNHEIDNVMVQEPFQLHEPRATVASSSSATTQEASVGDGCYVTAAVNNKRYYGVLVDQAALKAASLLYFQDEASGLDLNRRMKALLDDKRKAAEQQVGEAANAVGTGDQQLDRKRPAVDDSTGNGNKRIKTEEGTSNLISGDGASRQVQKFRYVEPASNGNGSGQGYRLLLATFSDVMAAAEDDMERAAKIEAACRSGGNFVGKYYYQYEVKCLALEARGHALSNGIRMSMGFESFLQTASLPPWFPLSNLQVGQQKVLSLLNMKKDNNGNVVWDEKKPSALSMSALSSLVPMKPRSRFRICVVGGGISGLSCCTEIFRESEREGIPVEIVLVEGRGRLGGRLCTDRETFKCKDGATPFPVDLGAQWIHGIELNPLASLAREAGAEFVTASESVKMFQKGMEEVDPEKDERAGQVFDKLLDLAAEDCWKSDSVERSQNRKHTAVKWYASDLDDSSPSVEQSGPVASEASSHRQSTDTSVDCAIGRAIANHKVSEFARLSDEERRMLMWNLKNVEYALGANISDLSMRFWDIDERHAFEGDHVMLRQGYSSVIDHMVKGLLKRDSFSYKLNFPVGKLEYSRKTTTQVASIPVGPARNRQLVELSDSCCVTSQDGTSSIDCDFVVSCVPLGVLKEAIKERPRDGSIQFVPPLPFSKQDAIGSVGFGLLDKVFLQFDSAFWRKNSLLGEDQTIFGNASGVNPHLYMFFDVGKSLGSPGDRPAVLMSLISGREAVMCECMSESQLITQTMETLRLLFTKITVPDPVAFKITRWGKDRFSRGSYTFLPPGTTDQDFHLLQSPINGNGDSLLLEGSETMRLFFAGEHTTALHPSMAHGAMLSGVRAAKEVFSAMNFTFNSGEAFERVIPMALYRHMNPKAPLICSLCHRQGTTIREGTLLAFKKGSRQVLVHNNCAENSPEVEVYDGKWKDVLKAVSRSRSISCFLCGKDGASIGCGHENCYRCYHFSCGEDTGWRFDDDGKLFYCDLHRDGLNSVDCVRISLDFYKMTRRDPGALTCVLCGVEGDDKKRGSLLAYQKREKTAVVHENCARYTSVVDLAEDSSSRMEQEYRNIFDAIERSRTCGACSQHGATVKCTEPSCSSCFHFACALDTDWDFDKRPRFRCEKHRVQASSKPKAPSPDPEKPPLESNIASGVFHHALFSLGTANPNKDVPGNLDIENSAHDHATKEAIFIDSSDSEEDDQLELKEHDDEPEPDIVSSEPPQPETVPSEPRLDVPTGEVLTSDYVSSFPYDTHLARIQRHTVDDLWNAEFYVSPLKNGKNQALLSVALARPDPHDELQDGDVIISINGMKIGSYDLDSLDKVLSRLGQEVEAMVEVRRARL